MNGAIYHLHTLASIVGINFHEIILKQNDTILINQIKYNKEGT